MARGLVVITVLALIGIVVFAARHDTDTRKRGSSVVSRTPHQSSTREPPSRRLARAPKAVVAACVSLQPKKTLKVLCPRRLPRAAWHVRYRSLERSRSRYLMDLRVEDNSGGAQHVLAGGRRRRFSLSEVDGHWPARVPRAGARCCARAGDLGLIGARERSVGIWEPVRMSVIRHARVRSRPALLLEAAPHPDGGIHGGHLVVVWNQGLRGYVFSIHAANPRRVTQRDEAVALAAAEAMGRIP
jgi:hypothetical protein